MNTEYLSAGFYVVLFDNTDEYDTLFVSEGNYACSATKEDDTLYCGYFSKSYNNNSITCKIPDDYEDNDDDIERYTPRKFIIISRTFDNIIQLWFDQYCKRYETGMFRLRKW
ncbi:MAG: hypothetical protein LBL91_04410 [Lachnospiraceae bacterium]|nr:hypothetical protein [Lachnospiraceae bacterium]